MELLLEFVLELAIWIALQAGVELGLSTARSTKPGRKSVHPVVGWSGAAVLGLMVGVLSTLPLPHHIFADSAMRIASLIVSPLAAGFAMYALGQWRRRRGCSTTHLASFPGGALFALGLGAVRFAILG